MFRNSRSIRCVARSGDSGRSRIGLGMRKGKEPRYCQTGWWMTSRDPGPVRAWERWFYGKKHVLNRIDGDLLRN